MWERKKRKRIRKMTAIVITMKLDDILFKKAGEARVG
jgi:hypothetical protein